MTGPSSGNQKFGSATSGSAPRARSSSIRVSLKSLPEKPPKYGQRNKFFSERKLLVSHFFRMTAEHIPDHDLECYYLGMVTDEEELALLKEHLLWCVQCVEQA